jgi:hypothetical protein
MFHILKLINKHIISMFQIRIFRNNTGINPPIRKINVQINENLSVEIWISYIFTINRDITSTIKAIPKPSN